MSAAVSLSEASSRLWQPRASLIACTRGVVARSTLGVALSDSQRLNFFPASPLCSITWWFAGHSEMLQLGDAKSQHPAQCARTALPSTCLFSGPQIEPTVSWNPGPAHAMMLLLLPDALQAMTGIDPESWLNRLVQASEVLPPTWLDMCAAVQQAPDDASRVRRMEDFLDPLWQVARPHPGLQHHRFQDWAEAVALRAAMSAPGRSLRQIERRVKRWAGQPLRELRGMVRAEQTFMEATRAHLSGQLSWTRVAADSGYADQSHMSRESKRVTGFGPKELRRRIEQDEAFWLYRLWGVSA